MTKKNILTAIAVVMSATAMMISTSITASASTFVDPTTSRILATEEVPDRVWDTIHCEMDVNGDREIRVTDAIQYKKTEDAASQAMSQAICNYIINDDNVAITISEAIMSQSKIEEFIRSDYLRLIDVWKADTNGDGENNKARFLFFDTMTAGFIVFETDFLPEENGFRRLWDYDGDSTVTKKDAAWSYLDLADENEATRIDSYAEFGPDCFEYNEVIPVEIGLTLEEKIKNNANIIGVNDYGISVLEDNAVIRLRVDSWF